MSDVSEIVNINNSCGQTYQIVTKKLHYQGRIFVAFFAQGIKLCSGCQYVDLGGKEEHTGDSIIEGLFGEMASLIWRVENLVVED